MVGGMVGSNKECGVCVCEGQRKNLMPARVLYTACEMQIDITLNAFWQYGPLKKFILFDPGIKILAVYPKEIIIG